MMEVEGHKEGKREIVPRSFFESRPLFLHGRLIGLPSLVVCVRFTPAEISPFRCPQSGRSMEDRCGLSLKVSPSAFTTEPGLAATFVIRPNRRGRATISYQSSRLHTRGESGAIKKKAPSITEVGVASAFVAPLPPPVNVDAASQME